MVTPECFMLNLMKNGELWTCVMGQSVSSVW